MNIRDTSLEAYESIKPELTKKQKVVLNAIKILQPCTDLEISNHLGWAINRVTPRRGELEKAGLIRSYERVKQVTGRSAWAWKIVPPGGFIFK